MAGSVSASTAAIVAAGLGAVGTTAGIIQGVQSSSQQKKALASQNQAQDTATAKALSTQRDSEIAQSAANMKTPDISTILQRASQAGKGLGSTMLTGAQGVDPSSLNLGRTSLLGA